jgi:site-specific recombinase XerD
MQKKIFNNTTKQEIMEKFLNSLKSKNYSQNTLDGYFIDLTQWFEFQFTQDILSADDFENVDLDDYLAHISDKAPTTRARKITSIKSLYKYLNSKFNITNITKDVKIKVGKRLPIYLSEDKSIDALNTVKDISRSNKDRNYLIVNLLLTTGVRVSELCNIRVSDVDFEKEELNIIGKGDKQRWIPLNPYTVTLLKEYIKKIKTDWLFNNTHGNQLTRHNVHNLIKNLAKELNIPKLSPHKCRHSCATMLLSNGTPIDVIQEILGHSSILTTQIYAHTDKSNVKKAIMNTKFSQMEGGV